MPRRLGVFLPLLLLGCGGHPNTVPYPQTMNQAVDVFFTAVKNKDLKGMANVWGDEKDLESNYLDADAFHKRVVTLQIYLSNRGYRIIQGPELVPGIDTRRTFTVELQRKNCSIATKVTVAQSRRGGWVWYGVDLTQVVTAAKTCQPDPADEVRP